MNPKEHKIIEDHGSWWLIYCPICKTQFKFDPDIDLNVRWCSMRIVATTHCPICNHIKIFREYLIICLNFNNLQETLSILGNKKYQIDEDLYNIKIALENTELLTMHWLDDIEILNMSKIQSG